jgi:PAS domain S-box-containing protein
MRLVLESITEYAILTLDASGTIVEWNAGAERMFGFSSDEAVGQPAALIFTPEDRARGAHLEEMRIATEQNRASDERWHVRKDGSRLYVSGVLSPIGPDPVTGFVKVARDLTDRKQQEEALRRAHDLLESRVEARTRELASQLSERQQAEDQVRKLLSRLITVQEDERRRIARDLHDDLGQKMTALHLKLEALCRVTTGGGAAHDQAKEAQAFVRQLDRDLDFFTWELRPAALYDLGLTQALRDFVEQWTVNYGIASDFEAIGVGHERWRQDIEVNLYRIAQEALNNVYKHARASRVDVVLQRREDELVLSVEDNGVGFDAPASVASRGRGMGLIGMRERSALLGGTLEIERAGSGGTTVIVRAPAAMDDSAVGDSEEPL